MNSAPTRYPAAIVVLHWLLAALVALALMAGTFALAQLPNSSPDKIGALRGHMTIGILIGVLMLVRLVARLRGPLPEHAPTGNALLDLLGKTVHRALYLLVLAMVASGVATALAAGLPDIVFRGAGALPADFSGYAARAVHGLAAKVLMALVALHVAGVIVHQFILRDRLLSRMWFGRR